MRAIKEAKEVYNRTIEAVDKEVEAGPGDDIDKHYARCMQRGSAVRGLIREGNWDQQAKHFLQWHLTKYISLEHGD